MNGRYAPPTPTDPGSPIDARVRSEAGGICEYRSCLIWPGSSSRALLCAMTIAAVGVSSEVRLQIDDLIDDRGQVIEDVLADPQLAQMDPIDPTIAPFLVDEPVCRLLLLFPMTDAVCV